MRFLSCFLVRQNYKIISKQTSLKCYLRNKFSIYFNNVLIMTVLVFCGMLEVAKKVNLCELRVLQSCPECSKRHLGKLGKN